MCKARGANVQQMWKPGGKKENVINFSYSVRQASHEYGIHCMRVQYKLFFITLLVSLTLVASMLFLAQWSFDRGLLEHVNRRAEQQYQGIAQQLLMVYAQDGNWARLKRSPYLWDQVLSQAGIDRPPASRGSRGRDDFARPPHREGFDRRPPPREYEREGRRPPPRGGEPLALVSVDRSPIAGRLAKPEHRRYFAVKNQDELLGYVVYANRERLMDDYDLDFASELSRNLWWIAGLMILVSASLALPFSYLLLKPLRPIVGTIHKLAKGDFSVRLQTANKDEIGRVAEDINHLAQALEENETSRKTWLANISHELRTPLAVMRGELEAMLDGIREINHDNLSSAHQEALQLQRLVEDLYELTSSDIGALKYQKHEVDLLGLVEDDLDRFSPLIEKAGLGYSFNNEIDEEQGAWVNVDPARISQLIHNLLNNSVKYTDVPGHVNVALTVVGDFYELSVEDSDPGVQADELEKIFDHLYRAEQSRNRKTGGSGLGLAICKKIAEGHGGELLAENSSLGGIKMILRLPVSDQ